MNKRTLLAFNPTVSGLVIGMLIFSMVIVSLATFNAGIQQSYQTPGNISITDYDKTTELVDHLQTIENSTNIQQQSGALDVIGGFFSNGYSALKIALLSFSTFENVNDQIRQDVPELNVIMTIFYWVIFAALIIGLAMAVLLKSRT